MVCLQVCTISCSRGAEDSEFLFGFVLQDFFDLEVIPSDTDYRMFSYKHGYGHLPGVDIATILDAEAYHTDRDASSRIRNGTLQVERYSRVTCGLRNQCLAHRAQQHSRCSMLASSFKLELFRWNTTHTKHKGCMCSVLFTYLRASKMSNTGNVRKTLDNAAPKHAFCLFCFPSS